MQGISLAGNLESDDLQVATTTGKLTKWDRFSDKQYSLVSSHGFVAIILISPSCIHGYKGG